MLLPYGSPVDAPSPKDGATESASAPPPAKQEAAPINTPPVQAVCGSNRLDHDETSSADTPAEESEDAPSPSDSNGKLPKSLAAAVFGAVKRIPAEPIVMLVLSIGGFILGARVIPPDDFDVVTAGQIAVEGPGAIKDAAGRVSLRSLTWEEAHDNAIQPRVSSFGETNEPQLPVLPAHAIRARIDLSFNRPLISDAPVELHVDLPEKAVITQCYSLDPHSSVDWHWQDRPPNDILSIFMSAIGVPLGNKYLQVNGTVPNGSHAILIAIDVTGVDGLSFASNRTRAKVLLPLLFTNGVTADSSNQTPNSPGQEPGVTMVADLPATETYTWSRRPVIQKENSEVWSQPLTNVRNSSDSGIPAPITGVREDVLRQDSRRDFWAGIVFGVAGAAVIGFIQSVFSAMRERRSSTQSSHTPVVNTQG